MTTLEDAIKEIKALKIHLELCQRVIDEANFTNKLSLSLVTKMMALPHNSIPIAEINHAAQFLQIHLERTARGYADYVRLIRQ